MLQPRIEAIVRNQFSVGLEQVNIRSHVDYTISRAGIFAVRLVFPADVRVEAVSATRCRRGTNETKARRVSLKLT